MKYIDLVLDRRGSQLNLVAFCEICHRKGGPEEVPFIIFYTQDDDGDDNKRTKACRCLKHRPGSARGDVLLKI